VRHTSFADMHCSLARGLELVGDWWSPLILRDLFLGITHFDELVEDLGISRNLLAARLKALVKGGIVARRLYQERPARYVYELAEAGRDLAPVLLALTAWGDRWTPPPAGKPLVFAHRTCGKPFEPRVSCSHCGEILAADEVIARPGPGGRARRGTRVLARRLQEGVK
jgi:DNA-binding HxlR family transcriptional regulator